jgi:hypothetical protein
MESKLLIQCWFIVVACRTPSKETYENACRKVGKSCSQEVIINHRHALMSSKSKQDTIFTYSFLYVFPSM